MKNLIFSLIILAAGSAQATSMMKVNNRLQLVVGRIANFHHLPVNERDVTLINVDFLGTVTGSRCREKITYSMGVAYPFYLNCKNRVVIEKLTPNEMRRMENQIAKARLGEIVYPNPAAIHCLAMPTESRKYVADNGTILLSSGAHPCGNVTYNSSKAAQALVETLNTYRASYSKGDN